MIGNLEMKVKEPEVKMYRSVEPLKKIDYQDSDYHRIEYGILQPIYARECYIP